MGAMPQRPIPQTLLTVHVQLTVSVKSEDIHTLTKTPLAQYNH